MAITSRVFDKDSNGRVSAFDHGSDVRVVNQRERANRWIERIVRLSQSTDSTDSVRCVTSSGGKACAWGDGGDYGVPPRGQRALLVCKD